MKKLLIATVLSVFALFSCEAPYQDPKNIEDRDYAIRDFTGIEISNAIEVEVIPSSNFKVTATGDYHELDYLSVKVRNNKLVAKCTRNRWFSSRSIKLFIEMPEIKSADLSGASTAKIEQFTNTNTISVDLSGASELLVDVVAKEIKGDLRGASELRILKNTDQLDLEVSGASKLEAFNAYTINTYLDLSGASEADVSVKDYLKVSASGASKVRYKGTPKIDQNISGSSKIIRY